MKLLPESTSFLLFLLLLVELPVLTMSRPTPARPHKDGLTTLLKQMHQLLNLVQRVLSNFDTHLPFEHKIPSLPTINFRPKDLAAVEADTTLSQLSAGLNSFKLHFDWLLHWENQSGLVSDETKAIADRIQFINTLVHRQMPQLPPQSTTLSLPALNSAWEMFQTSAIVHRRLVQFCDWYLRALRVLSH
ncbi:uncharacterized protein il11b [Pygocentrus nattereri]|uniref:uncharacterized protein il11b n=1 Tax=Pygocentrus nattereri TaxID=42514 RepID=UPI00189155EA|nr:uncharacterized protein il11b [Pygocentrus nattereri]